MKLRDHSHMRFDGVSNWPPAWTVMGPGHSVLRGEFGVLTDAYTNGIGSNICFLVMEVYGESIWELCYSMIVLSAKESCLSCSLILAAQSVKSET
jgi:hypothetical protein